MRIDRSSTCSVRASYFHTRPTGKLPYTLPWSSQKMSRHTSQLLTRPRFFVVRVGRSKRYR